MVNEPRTDETVKKPRSGERIQQSASDERRELVLHLLCAFNSNKELRQQLGDIFRELEAAGIEPGDFEAWAWAASMRLDAIKQLVGRMPGAEHAVIISEMVNPLLERYPLLKALDGWPIMRDSYQYWHDISRLATVPLSADLRALFRREEPEWFWAGVGGKAGRGGRTENPTLLYADLWERVGLTDDPDRSKLLYAHHREWPILDLPRSMECAVDYGEFERGGLVPRITFTIEVDIPLDPQHHTYTGVMKALEERFEAARKETDRQYKAILERGKEQGLKERPANPKLWQYARWLYLVEVQGKSMGWIQKYENVDKAQVSRACRSAAELLDIQFS
jgi:hypothetical protein